MEQIGKSGCFGNPQDDQRKRGFLIGSVLPTRESAEAGPENNWRVYRTRPALRTVMPQSPRDVGRVVIHIVYVGRVLRYGPGGTATRSGTFDPCFLDLIEEGFVAHAEKLSGLAPVPSYLLQRVGDDRAFGCERSLTRHFREPTAVVAR